MQPCLFWIVTSYSVKHTNVVLTLSPLSNPSKLSSQNVLVISLARSGRKLKKMTESFSLTVATGAPSFYDNCWHYELIRCIFVIRMPGSPAVAACCLLRLLRIQVHCKPSPHDPSGYHGPLHSNVRMTDATSPTPISFILASKLLYILFSGCRWCVTSVQEAVYINFLKSLSLCQLQKSVNMSVYGCVHHRQIPVPSDEGQNHSSLHFHMLQAVLYSQRNLRPG